MKSVALIFGMAIVMCATGCASRGIFEVNPRKIPAHTFEMLLRANVTLQEVKQALGEPRMSGGSIDVAPNGSVIDLPRFDYVLALEDRKGRSEVVFVSFWFRDSRVSEVYLRDPKSLENLVRLFPTNDLEAQQVRPTERSPSVLYNVTFVSANMDVDTSHSNPPSAQFKPAAWTFYGIVPSEQEAGFSWVIVGPGGFRSTDPKGAIQPEPIYSVQPVDPAPK